MSYQYEIEKGFLFTDEGQRMFLSVRDNVQRLLDQAGAVSMERAIWGQVGNNWHMMACVDRLVELGEIREITKSDVPGQYRIFVKTKE